MKRAAILVTLSGAALLFVACTNDFDALFANNQAPDDIDPDDDDTTPSPSTSGSTGGSSSSSGEEPTECPASKVGCNAGTGGVASPDPKTCGCTLSCSGGAKCGVQDCGSQLCKIVTDDAFSSTTCTAQECDLECTGTAKCLLDCSGAQTCHATCTEGSTCSVECPFGGDCDVSCGKGIPAKQCDDGTRACGECINIKG